MLLMGDLNLTGRTPARLGTTASLAKLMRTHTHDVTSPVRA